MENKLLDMKNISKSFPGVKALDNVSVDIYRGEVLALMGENGAGKSTLIKILSGVYMKDSGDIVFEGKKVNITSPKHSQELGISIMHQELNLVPNLSIAENIFLGRENKKTGMLDKKTTVKLAEELLHEVELNCDVNTLVADLSISQRQMVELAKALSINAKLIIMDEPTSSLTDKEIEILMRIIRKLRDKQVSIIYISHKLEEVMDLSNRITVLRDGQLIGTVNTNECNENELIKMMVGREITEIFEKEHGKIGDEIFKVNNLSADKVLKNISFGIKKGEILGFSGLVGAGRSELMRAIFGVDKYDEGEIIIDGKKVTINEPKDAISFGLGFLPEDRKLQGLILGMTVKENISIACLEVISKLGVVDETNEAIVAEEFIEKLSIKTPSKDQKTLNLSGGNQQKVVISKWLATRPKILILDEPTRGIDIGAKKEIYSLMGKLTQQGVAIILVSSELPEILGLSDRVIVMHDGMIKGELSKENATQERILSMALN